MIVQESPTPSNPPPPPTPRTGSFIRPRLHLIYFALAAFDLLTISLGLYLINRISAIYSHSVQVNQAWGGRLDDYLELMRMAAAVNGPGNDVFETRAIDREWQALQQSRSAFEERAAALRRDLLENVSRDDSQPLLLQFDQIDAAMARMVEHAETLFDHLRRNELAPAAAQMSEMDRQYVTVIGALRELGAEVRDLQRAHTEQQAAVAAAWRRLSDLPPAAREQFAAVRRSVAYLQQLSDGLHLLALDPDDPEASAGSTNLNEWWAQIGPLMLKAVPKRVTLEQEFQNGLPDIAVPPHRLTQAVLNLVVNAGEAIADRGLVRITASADADGHMVRLGVSDTGRGMSQDVIKQAFDPFFTTKKRGLGTGLGLSLVRGVAQGAGGSVSIDSEPGKGTTVALHLPSAAVADKASGNGASGDSAVVSLRDRRIASFVSALLQSSGLTVKYGDEPEIGAGRCRVWVTQADAGSFDAARRYLKGNRRGRVIVFGTPQDPWDLPGVQVVDDPMDFDAVRSAIGKALSQMDEALT